MSVPLGVVLLAVGVACICDVRKFKVYNALTIPMFVGGMIYHGALDGAAGLLLSFYGALFGFGALIIPYILGAMGAGDVKLAAGIGAWLGASLMVPVLVIGLLATAGYSLFALLLQGRLGDAWLSFRVSLFQLAVMGRHFLAVENQESVQEIAKQPDMRRRLIPFSVMLAIGILAAVLGQVMGVKIW